MSNSIKWWESKPNEAHNDVIQTVNNLRNEQSYRQQENIRNARLYGNMDVLGLTAFTYARTESGNLDNRVTMNVVQSCIDTSEAKIASKTPEPMFITEAGDYDAQAKAKKLTKFVKGLNYDLGTKETAAKCFKDGGVFGSGLHHTYSAYGKIMEERVFPNEILVDDVDAFYGSPQCLYREKSIDKTTLQAAFPKFAAQIHQANPVRDDYGIFPNRGTDRIQIAEAWKLPVLGEKNGKKEVVVPGRHVLVIDGATLNDEPWDRDHFPFAKFDYNPKLYGFWAQGLAEILMGKQIEINKVLRNIQLAFYFCSTPIWMKEAGSKVLDAYLNNRIGNILTYKGVRPSLETFRSVNPEQFQHLMWLIQTSFEEAGISQLAAASKNPLGANASGKALMTFNDFETERFSRVAQRWEQFHMDIAKHKVEEAKSLYKNKSVNLSVKAENGAFVETIKFSDIDLEQSKYVMKVWPVSAFSSTPAAKYQEVMDGVNLGLFDADTAAELLDMPDLENKTNLRTAKRKLIQKIYEKMVEDKKYMPPEPFMDLQYALDYGQNYYNLSKLNLVPEDRLELIRTFLAQAQLILQSAQPQPDMTAEIPPEEDPMMGMQEDPEMFDQAV